MTENQEKVFNEILKRGYRHAGELYSPAMVGTVLRGVMGATVSGLEIAYRGVLALERISFHLERDGSSGGPR